MDIAIIDKSLMREVCPMKEAIEQDKLALKLYTAGKTEIPLRANLPVENGGQSLYMMGYVPDVHALGVKLVSVFPTNQEKGLPVTPALMVLKDDETGQVKGLIDGTYLTQLRTGAVSGAATDLLANPEARTFLLIGTGGQAATQLEAVLAVRDIETVYVADRDIERAQTFAREMKTALAFTGTIEAVKDANEVVGKADVITTVTTSKKPVYDGALVAPGTHINAVGSYMPEMQETPAELISRADRIFVDTIDGVLQESGDLLIPLKEGLISRDKAAHELGALIAGEETGRSSSDEISYFNTTGSAVLDLVVAQWVYQKALARGNVPTVTL